ncbi:hypothetical protein SAMN04488134_101767 [Amphibacillus marinus]|uniref:DUF2313 domain-containing protein n=1 Tax=Amphibacillus marinus TaxID=872970 RepID=A0A1H8IZM5_9BACI|nr:putative phage tail protein [Amphibacillus marinus]SEN73367.1 hypothetical protein SAMN04488134_101767 [Amphibacillus marinus]
MRVERINLEELKPSFYKDVLEMDALIHNYGNIFENLRLDTQRVQDNAYVMLCDDDALRVYEDMFRIIADSVNESNEFRRLRVLNRMTSRPPFTYKFLVEKLSEIFGNDHYAVFLDYDDQTLYIESAATTSDWYKEVSLTVNAVKPVNMRYIQIPVHFEQVRLIERAFLLEMTYARVGYARVGRTPLEERLSESEVELI